LTIVTTDAVDEAVLEEIVPDVPEGFVVPSSLMLETVPWRLSAERYTDMYFEPPPQVLAGKPGHGVLHDESSTLVSAGGNCDPQ
jgi:hypothetical protein